MDPGRRASVIVFVMVACALAWCVALPLWLGDGLASGPVAVTVVASAMMFTPTIAALVALLGVERTGWRGFVDRTGLRLGAKPAVTVWVTLGLLGVLWVTCLIVPFVAVLLGGMSIDWSFPVLAEQVAASGQDLPMPLWLLALISVLQVPVVAFMPNGILAAGEEIGWRGYLLPALLPLGRVPALLISGVIWGLWHTPLILLGYNFQTSAWWGPVAMAVGCVLLGVVLGWGRLRTDSVWPAAVGHGAFNAAAGAGMIIAATSPEPIAILSSPLGVPGWILLGILAVVALTTLRWTPRAQPETPDVPEGRSC